MNALPHESDNTTSEWKVIGWDYNPPDPFPGFGGKLGLGQDVIALDDGEWLIVFHAGYWHLSAATPMVAPQKYIEAWKKNGYPADHVAPRGGRILSMRSRDQGKTWTHATTVFEDRWDVSPVGINRLTDGGLLVFVNQQASWYGFDTPPDGHLPVNTRIGVIRSNDRGHTWSEPTWLDMPQSFYQRAYAQAVTMSDGALLYPTYTTDRFDGQLNGAIHCSNDGGYTWQTHATLSRSDGGPIDEPSLTLLDDGRLMLITRIDAAVFYSDDGGRSWRFSHHAPFAPLKAHRTAVLNDGTVICWMTSHGTLRTSWSTDCGQTWHTDAEGRGWLLAERYGYPGGCLLDDGSILAVYYDATHGQRRTAVWATRFRISDDRQRLIYLSAPVRNHADTSRSSQTASELDVDVMHTSKG